MSTTPRTETHPPVERLPVTLPALADKKRLGEPIVMVTAYDYPSARVVEEAGVDMVLVGDSAAMVVLGYESTVPVSLDEMLMLASAVRRGLDTPFLVGDLPFGSYEASDEQAIATAQRFVKEAGCDAVKLERGGSSIARARAIVDAGIPVMGHVGLTPQTATALGGYRAQGRTAERALDVARDAVALEEAGCFSLVFEAIPAAVAAEIMPRLSIPVIGIGAGAGDGRPGPGLPRPARHLRRPRPALRQALRAVEAGHGRRGLRVLRRGPDEALPGPRAHVLDRPRRAGRVQGRFVTLDVRRGPQAALRLPAASLRPNL